MSDVITLEKSTAGTFALPTTANSDDWTEDQKALLDFAGLVVRKRNQPPVPAPKSTVVAFLQQCERTALDPVARQIYAIERGGKWTIQVSIDGMRLVAQRSRLYRGQSKAQWTDGTLVKAPMRDLDGSIVRDGDGSIVWTEDFRWLDVWTGPGYPVAARVSVRRQDFDEPLTAVARWDTYKVENDEWSNGAKTGRKVLGAQWEKGGDNQLAKCAESLALRKAFPMDLSGLYSTEEMEHLDASIVTPPGQSVPRPAVLAAGTRSAQRDPITPETDDEAADDAPGADVRGEQGGVCERCGDDGDVFTDTKLCQSCDREVAEEYAEEQS